jgi:hypothetical protein
MSKVVDKSSWHFKTIYKIDFKFLKYYMSVKANRSKVKYAHWQKVILFQGKIKQ